MYKVLVHRLAGLAYSSFSPPITRRALTSAGSFMSMFSSCVGLSTGDLNPIRTVPMLGTPKRMQATARRLSVVSATSCARRRLIRDVRPRSKVPRHEAHSQAPPFLVTSRYCAAWIDRTFVLLVFPIHPSDNAKWPTGRWHPGLAVIRVYSLAPSIPDRRVRTRIHTKCPGLKRRLGIYSRWSHSPRRH